MPLSFACAVSHAPGLTAWPDAAPSEQKDRIYGAFGRLERKLADSRTDALVLLTSEHWANFFLDHMGGFCVGRAAHYDGPIEPWLKIDKAAVPGAPELAGGLLDYCADNGFEPTFSHEMVLDHGSMVPLHFLTPKMNVPVVPIIFNTLAPPQPSPQRCLELGQVIGRFLQQSDQRVAVAAAGGLSHAPGERNHGVIDSAFDRRFLDRMASGDMESLGRYTRGELAEAGSGAFEVLAWIALAGALDGRKGEVLAYEAVVPWATGIGVMAFDVG